MSNCIKCGKETKKCLSFDIDLPKFPSCKKCIKSIKIALHLAWLGQEATLEVFTKDWKQPFKLNDNKKTLRKSKET